MVLIAVLVLLAAALAIRTIATRSARRSEPPGAVPGDPGSAEEPSSTTWSDAVALIVPAHSPGPAMPEPAAGLPTQTGEVMSFLIALGEAMVESSDPVTHVEVTLKKVAAANGVPEAEIVVMPTALFVSVPSQGTVQTAVSAAGSAPLRLDQVDAVFDVVSDAERGRIGPVVGLERLAQARSMAPEFSARSQVFGYIVMTLGLALILGASWTGLAISAVLGAAVGSLQRWAGRFSQPFQVFVPVLSAFGVSASVFLLGRAGIDISGLSPLIAPLVALLPGALLTTGVIELATGQIVSGAGRLAAGGMRLVLLALGLLAGSRLVGVPAGSAAEVATEPLGALAAWLGVAIFGVGAVVNRCARRASLGWILLVLYVAFAGQVIGGLLLGSGLAAFCGALAMTPVAFFVASQPSGPTTLVTFLPAFWLLVPGAAALVGVTSILGEEQALGLTTLVNAGATMASIALGIMLGLVVSIGLSAARVSLPRRGGVNPSSAEVDSPER